MQGIQCRLLGILLSASDEGLCQAKKVVLSGRSGFCRPTDTFMVRGFFRPGGWEALLAKKKEEGGKPKPSLSLTSERMS